MYEYISFETLSPSQRLRVKIEPFDEELRNLPMVSELYIYIEVKNDLRPPFHSGCASRLSPSTRSCATCRCSLNYIYISK